jgi:dolichol-phosphate mannosyltransferase
VALSAFAVLAIAIYLLLWLTYEKSWPAGFATLAILMLVSIAINAILLGIIGEYVARIYSQVRPQPLTIVERLVDRAEPAVSGTGHHAVQPVDDIVLPAADAARRDGTKASSDEP